MLQAFDRKNTPNVFQVFRRYFLELRESARHTVCRHDTLAFWSKHDANMSAVHVWFLVRWLLTSCWIFSFKKKTLSKDPWISCDNLRWSCNTIFKMHKIGWTNLKFVLAQERDRERERELLQNFDIINMFIWKCRQTGWQTIRILVIGVAGKIVTNLG